MTQIMTHVCVCQAAAATPLYACLGKGLESGSYLDDCKVTQLPGSFVIPYKQWSQLWDETQVNLAVKLARAASSRSHVRSQ